MVIKNEQFIGELQVKLKENEKVKVTGLGIFVIKQRAKSVRRNPKTGERVEVPARKVVKFRPGKAFKEALGI